MKRMLAGGVIAVLAAFGCESPGARLNAPPHGEQAEKPDMQGTFVYMADNALLENMTVCDYHFLPHRDLLTGLGKQRLARLAALMEEYGGTIRFDTTLEDEALVADRTQAIIAYLHELGVDTTSQRVTQDAPLDGVTRSADEAILIRAFEGTYQPRRRGGQGGTGGGAPQAPTAAAAASDRRATWGRVAATKEDLDHAEFS